MNKLILILILLAPACRDCQTRTSNDEKQNLSNPQLIEFCEKFAQICTEGDLAGAKESFNSEGYIARFFEGSNLSPDKLEALTKEFDLVKDRLPSRILLPLMWSETQFIKVLSFEGEPTPLFRRYEHSSLSSYFFLRVHENDSGDFNAVDFLSFTAGVWKSDSIKKILFPILNEAEIQNDELIFSENDEAAFDEKRRKMKVFINTLILGDHLEIQKAYQSLPLDLKQLRYFKSCYLLSLTSDVEKQKTEAKKYEDSYPNHFATHFLMLTVDIGISEWDSALKRITKVRETIGDDSYLYYLSGEIYSNQENHSAAIQAYQSAVSHDPHFELAWESLLYTFFMLDRSDDFATALKDYRKRLDKPYPIFEASDEITDWYLSSPAGLKHSDL